MPFQLSPGVQVVEKDFTSIVPAVSVSNGAICGPFLWGPVEDPIRISSENELVSLFGRPKSQNYAPWFTAANFLAYSNSLLVTRIDSNAVNAVSTTSSGIRAIDISVLTNGTGYANGTTIALTFTAPFLTSDAGSGLPTATATWYGDTNGIAAAWPGGGGSGWQVAVSAEGYGYVLDAFGNPDVTVTVPDRPPVIVDGSPVDYIDAQFKVSSLDRKGVKIKNLDHYLTGFADETGVHGLFAAKFPGTKANGIKVVMVDFGNWTATPEAIRKKFSAKPGTSSFAAAKGIYHDEMHIAIYDTQEGSFSGTPNALLETFEFVSKLSDAKRDDGSTNFYKNVLNNNSKYVWHLRTPSYNVFSTFTNDAGTAEVASSAMQFVQSSSKIIISASGEFATISSFKQFFDAAEDKATRQIVVSGTQFNNFAFTVVSVNAVVDNAVTTAYEITVTGGLTDESATAAVVQSVNKLPWGLSSDQVTQYAGNSYFAVLSDTATGLTSGFTSTLSGGTDDLVATEAKYQSAYSIIANQEIYDVSLLPLPNLSSSLVNWVVSNVAESRKDCVVFVSPNTAYTGGTDDGSVTGGPIAVDQNVVTNTIAFRDATQVNSSYAVMDSGFKYMYDRYNDTYRWVPLSGDVAGLCARTDLTADPWFSPGGFNRGVIKNIVKLNFVPNQSQRDQLYVNGVNPVVTFRGQGTVLYGDKTMLTKPSAFDRINVRRLFIVLEKAIAIASRSQLFEFNDGFTRAQFKNMVEPFLRDVQGRRGVTDFRVVCDETNNSGEVIDRNEFVADIYIKPNRSINFITLNFIAARSSISFEEIGA